MLEWGATLRTWALAREPLSQITIEAEQLSDHRAAYLDYEGPISDDRGTVSRWDAGDYRLLGDAEKHMTLAVSGNRMNGILTLERPTAGGHLWRVSFSADPTTG